MKNLELAKIFYQMAEHMEMADIQFKPLAYEKVARGIEALSEDIENIYQEDGRQALFKIAGVGQGIADKIEEFFKTGKIKEYEKLKKQCPVDLENLSAIEGLGPKSIKTLYQKLKIKTLADLEKAAKAGKIRNLEHFGVKSEENILRGIEFLKKGQGRMLLGHILPLIKKIEERLKNTPGVGEAVACGSVRRRKETVGDIDILAVAKQPQKSAYAKATAGKIMDVFISMPEVQEILAKGETKSMVRLRNGLDADLRVVKPESFGAALQYFTGSKDHNVATRKIAQDKGLKLNEYGLFQIQNSKIKNQYFGKLSIDPERSRMDQNHNLKFKIIAGRTEEEIYETLGLQYIEPELREMRGEIEAARAGKLPKLIGLKDVKGDLQIHSTWSDGAYSTKEMADEARKMGYEYIAITDHVGHLKIAGALSESDIKKQWAEIDKLNKFFSGKFRILKGAEVDIDADGSIACADKTLAQFDIVLGSLHSQFKMPKEQMTKRLVRAMENPHVDIISHPTTRIIGKRDEVALDWDEIFKTAKRTKTILEINCYPDRADLSDIHIKQAIEAGVLLSLGTDAHSKEQLRYMELGVYQARRGWAEKKDIINCWSLEKMKKALK